MVDEAAGARKPPAVVLREAACTLAEAIALTAFLIFIALIAMPSFPLARPSSAQPPLRPGRVEAPARVNDPHRAGRDEIADLIGGSR